MSRSAKSTLIQLLSRNYLIAGIGCSAILAFVTVMLNIGSPEEVVEERGPLGESATLEQVASSGGLALALAGTITMVGMVQLAVNASVIASDYSTGSIRNLVVRQPNRLRLLAGKTLALGVATLAVTVAMVVVTTAAAVAFAPAEVDTSVWFSGSGFRALGETSVNYFVALLGWGVLGQVVATLTRSSVVALATGVMIAIPLDLVLADTVESSRPWLPGQLFQALAHGGTRHLAYASSLVTVLGAGAACLILSFGVFHYRDI